MPRFTPQTASHLAAQITRRFNTGGRVFDIRLDPPELGRVDVRLELSGDQRVQAILSVDRPETLAELQRSARDLERALADAGLDLDQNGMEFQLNERDDQPSLETSDDPDTWDVFAETDYLDEIESSEATTLYGFALTRRGGVDVRI